MLKNAISSRTHVDCLIRPSPSVFVQYAHITSMPLCILPASMSLYAVCPLYARIPLMHLYVYFITRIFVYSYIRMFVCPFNNISMPLIYVPIRALPILALLFAPYSYREVALGR